MPKQITFVLGAGFSVAAGFPLLRPGELGDLTDRLVHFMLAERNPAYRLHMVGSKEWSEGQFFAGLHIVDPERQLGFEELMVALSKAESADSWSPHHLTHRKLKVGCERFFWALQSNGVYEPFPYQCFGERVKALIQKGVCVAVVSFNWDLMAEWALTEASVPWDYRAGDRGTVHVIKPHGSINWINRNGTAYGQVATGVWFSLDRPFENPFRGQEAHGLRIVTYPGDAEDNEAARELRGFAADALSRSDQIVFIGYSMPEYDSVARRMIVDGLSRREEVAIQVVDPSHETRERYGSLWPSADLKAESLVACYYGRRS